MTAVNSDCGMLASRDWWLWLVFTTDLMYKDVKLGAYCEVGARTKIAESSFGDYSYVVNDSDIIYTTVGKFCSIASHARINPGNHPTQRVAMNHFTYRSSAYGLGEDDPAFFDWRRSFHVTLGHDVWIGHGATIMPGVKVRRTGGHTMHHQMVLLESTGKTAAYVADLIPTTAHVPEAWTTAFDLYPMDTLAAKKSAHPFKHGGEYRIGTLKLVSSYHCSRYNTNTGVLTEKMFDTVVKQAKMAAMPAL